MPQPHLRTRNRKRLKVKLPSGENIYHYKREVTKARSCFKCDSPIHGIPHSNITKLRKLNKSRKRISRPYGGKICHNCLKNALKQALHIS